VAEISQLVKADSSFHIIGWFHENTISMPLSVIKKSKF